MAEVQFIRDNGKVAWAVIPYAVYEEMERRLAAADARESITSPAMLDFGHQLAEIGALQPGWLNGRGEAFDKKQLRRLGVLFRENYSLDKHPWVYPEQDGLLLAEWEVDDWRLSMEIELASLKGDFFALNIADNQEFSRDFDLSDPNEWTSLCGVLKDPKTGVQA